MTSPGDPSAEENPGQDTGGAPYGAQEDNEERWLDDQAGPLVRPYVMTSGRMQPVRGTFDLVTMVEATGLPVTPELGLGPEHQAAVNLCEQVMSVAEIAGHLKLPTVTVRVLLGDLLDKGLITAQDPQTDTDFMNDEQMYRAVIDGLHAL
ncbi:DUF742 domain-containing protein [Actinomadura sp. DC4]|uniref:DUF742 domain-containing protein n=1 Tax=Actinomadura sp. DC4 TaxID=3055069 RepID=UPI0025B16CE8|nr:DUF742 domain-containing protein [Actinomadura sp. DC4]MDN3351094.1 DUF742 domain-containing protein [Actinomadura sp. DC4]